MKVTYTKILARNILLTFLTFVIVLAIAAIFVRNTIVKKLEDIAQLASNVDHRVKPEQALLLLHQAEDDFQESLLNPNGSKSDDYKLKLTSAFNKIDTLLKTQTDTSQLTTNQSVQVKLWYHKKLALSDKLFGLKHNFDSLLTAYATFNSKESEQKTPITSNTIRTRKKTAKSHTDTVEKALTIEKKGLFGRLKDAISNKTGSVNGVIIINHNNNTNVADKTTQKIIARDRTDNANKIRELQQHNIELLNMQRELIALNTHISNELERIVNDLKEINYNMADQLKGMAFKNYRDTTALLNKFYLIALFLVLVFATLLIIFIIQLNKAELLLRKENDRSVHMAQQKMDLLSHMSHEIRNPLTAIKGFLHIFGKTGLSKRQSDMLESIKGSSDMVLRTLNDTLDAAKMENSTLKIDRDPFNPDFNLTQVIESMSYSATKKQLGLEYNFTGNKQAIVVGDALRLKQILINLLSNAIKYTREGKVIVNAELLPNTNTLKVDVVDTGSGINKEEQVHLFSKYYQAKSSKGQIGTGLGLFICKQLIEQQGGTIGVNSVPGTGTTFYFSIPYTENDNDAVMATGVENPISILNGVSILAVDDNELNLMFLKVMTAKWNVKFYQATNGKEAIEIISKNHIKVVLTDIQMPEMDGNELVLAVRALASPLNQLPVIVMSGTSELSDQNALSEKGFSGFIEKPFVEAAVITQLIKVLKPKA